MELKLSEFYPWNNSLIDNNLYLFLNQKSMSGTFSFNLFIIKLIQQYLINTTTTPPTNSLQSNTASTMIIISTIDIKYHLENILKKYVSKV